MSEVTKSALATLLSGNPDYVALLASILNEANEEAIEKAKPNTIASRKQAWVDMVKNFDVDGLLELQDTMKSFVDKHVGRLEFDPESPRELTHEEAVGLMSEYQDVEKILEFMETQKASIRDATFGSLTAKYEAMGIEDPEIEPGEIRVPELGKRFCKEGGGRTAPSLDEVALAELMGEDWDKVTDTIEVEEVVIPAHTEVVLNEEKLMKLAVNNPAILELVRKSLIPGKPKNVRFQVRPLPKNDKKK